MKMTLKISYCYFFALLLGVPISLIGQDNTYNPYERFGEKGEVLTLSNGKFDEFFDLDSIEIIGSAVLNTNTMQVIGFIEIDTMYSEATLEPEIVSRWLSPDPMTAKYPEMSPYNFVGNNPITNVDQDGNDFIVIIWATASGEVGHAAIAVENYRKVTKRVTIDEEVELMGMTFKPGTYTYETFEPDGTYTYYDNWPGGDDMGKKNLSEVEAYRSKVEIKKEDLTNGNLTKKYPMATVEGGIPSENHMQDGVVYIQSGHTTDQKLHTILAGQNALVPIYDADDYNCADYVSDCIEELYMFKEDIGTETDVYYYYDATTPNQLWRDVIKALDDKNVKYEILVDPGDKVNNTFSEGYEDNSPGNSETPEERSE